MKNEWITLVGAILSVLGSFIPYFLNYLSLSFAVLFLFVALILTANIYMILRMRELETSTRRHSLVLNVFINGLIKIQQLSRTQGVTVNQLLETLSQGVEEVFGTISKDYFGTHHSSGMGAAVERRKRGLLEKARTRTITQDEGIELQGLLEKQKKLHEKTGDIGGAILAGLLLLFIIAILAALFGSGKDKSSS